MLSYFDSELGIGYNYLRIPLGSTDFSDVFYTYDDTNAEDPKLEQFSLANIDYDLKVKRLFTSNFTRFTQRKYLWLHISICDYYAIKNHQQPITAVQILSSTNGHYICIF